MTTLIVAYVVAWAGIGAYAARLLVRERALFCRLRELGLCVESAPNDLPHVKEAA